MLISNDHDNQFTITIQILIPLSLWICLLNKYDGLISHLITEVYIFFMPTLISTMRQNKQQVFITMEFPAKCLFRKFGLAHFKHQLFRLGKPVFVNSVSKFYYLNRVKYCSLLVYYKN